VHRGAQELRSDAASPFAARAKGGRCPPFTPPPLLGGSKEKGGGLLSLLAHEMQHVIDSHFMPYELFRGELRAWVVERSCETGKPLAEIALSPQALAAAASQRQNVRGGLLRLRRRPAGRVLHTICIQCVSDDCIHVFIVRRIVQFRISLTNTIRSCLVISYVLTCPGGARHVIFQCVVQNVLYFVCEASNRSLGKIGRKRITRQ
jgi:hypothetical protein